VMPQLTVDVTKESLQQGYYSVGHRGRALWSILNLDGVTIRFEPEVGSEAGYLPIAVSAAQGEGVFKITGAAEQGFTRGDRLCLYYALYRHSRNDFRYATYEHSTGSEVFVRHVIARADPWLGRRLEGVIPPAAELRSRAASQLWSSVRDDVLEMMEEAELRGLDAAMALDDLVETLGASGGACLRNEDGELVPIHELVMKTSYERGRALGEMTKISAEIDAVLEIHRPERLNLRASLDAIRSGRPLPRRG